MDSSNNPNPVESAAPETASPVENSQVNDNSKNIMPSEVEKPVSLKDAILSRKKEGSGDPEITPEAPAAKADAPAAPVVPAAVPEAPKYEANYKFKAFGKEKEIPEAFRSIIKDPESERQVREVFTRAEAFDDMKGRYENTQRESQQILSNFAALDKDVKRVMGYRNKGDLDNFFASIKLTDQDIIQHLQNKAQYMQDPNLKAQYDQQVQHRAELLNTQEQYESLQQNYSNQAVQTRTMQLDHVLSRPDVQSTASAWDEKMGEAGAFRNLVIQEAASYYHTTKQDLPADAAVQLALQKFGKLVQQGLVPQAPVPVTPTAPASQTPGQPVVVAKPVIPTLNGKGTSPVKQAPKSLADLRRMGKEAAAAEATDNY
jgi:hypothetical protein